MPDEENWGYWSVWKDMDAMETELEKLMPNPRKVRLIGIDVEYTPATLNDCLQQFGSHLATLHSYQGLIKGQAHALKESYKNGMRVKLAEHESSESTVTARESEILAKPENEIFRDVKRKEINHESLIELLKGWIDAYQDAWDTISRIITLRTSELNLNTGRIA